jgi:hypothetical protein
LWSETERIKTFLNSSIHPMMPMMFLSYWEKIGFSVTRLTHNTFQQLHDELTKAQEARNAEIAIVYYAAMG